MFALKAGVVYVAVLPPLPTVTLVQLVLPSADCCHCIVPVYPETVTVVVEPLKTEKAAAVAVPPTEAVTTVIPPETELVLLHPLELVTTQ